MINTSLTRHSGEGTSIMRDIILYSFYSSNGVTKLKEIVEFQRPSNFICIHLAL